MRGREKSEHANIVIWCGLSQHHMESARNLPEETRDLIGQLKNGECPLRDDLVLVPIREGNELAGFGVVLGRMRTPLGPHQVRTSFSLPTIFEDGIKITRGLFRKLGFTRAANLYVTALNEPRKR